MNTIDVFELSRAAAHWEGSLPLAAMARLSASLAPDPGGPPAALRYACQSGPDAQGRPGLQLQLQAVLPLRCDRCGELLAFALHAQSRFYFVQTEEQLAAIPIDDTPDEALLGSSRFDLAELLEDEAILQLPISPRHAQCPGRATVRPGPAAAAPEPAPTRPHPFAGLRQQLQTAPQAPGGADPALPGAVSAPVGPKTGRGGS